MFNTKLKRKEIEKDFYGVFAREKISRNELLFGQWNNNCLWLTRKEVLNLEEPHKSIFQKYCTEISRHLYVGPFPDENIDDHIEYFINHSCDPNAWLINDEDVVARRDIEAGEQVTIDYATFIIHEFESSAISNCQCGSPKCRGKVSSNDWWTMRKVYRGHFTSWIEQKITEKEKKENENLAEE